MQRLRRRFTKTGVVVVTILAALVLLAGVALAITVVWTPGQGTTNGACTTTSTNDPNVPAGKQNWLFILTNPDPGPWTLTANFQDAGQLTANGVQQGGGAVH